MYNYIVQHRQIAAAGGGGVEQVFHPPLPLGRASTAYVPSPDTERASNTCGRRKPIGRGKGPVLPESGNLIWKEL
jgi:hypothetical protein